MLLYRWGIGIPSLVIHLPGFTTLTSFFNSISKKFKGTIMQKAHAIVYSEGFFTAMEGKTANGLARHSETYRIVGVIDSRFAGRDAGEVLDGEPNGIPIFQSLDDALNTLAQTPQTFIYGIAPLSGDFSTGEIELMERAMAEGMDIVSGMHRFLNCPPLSRPNHLFSNFFHHAASASHCSRLKSSVFTLPK
jgi:hypothetical protein